MEFRRQVCRTLHQDHLATLALLARLESLLGRHGSGRPPDAASPEIVRLLKETIRAVEGEIGPHFAFEEESLFPLFAEAGERDMGEYLLEEHRAILPLAQRLAQIARLALDAGFAAEIWAEFHETVAAFVERLASHVEKEEGALLPALDDLLDEESDGRLAVDFAERR